MIYQYSALEHLLGHKVVKAMHTDLQTLRQRRDNLNIKKNMLQFSEKETAMQEIREVDNELREISLQISKLNKFKPY